MKLVALLDQLTEEHIPDVDVVGLVNDSRDITAGRVFLAEKGLASHGLEHLTDTQLSVAAAVCWQPPYDISRFHDYQHKLIAVDDLDAKVGEISRRFFTQKSGFGKIGITGTNGKTSIANFIGQILACPIIGTMGYGVVDNLSELSHTTPNALQLQKILAELSNNYNSVAMEVSSHALALQRVNAVDFSVGVYSNLSQDHLDFHADMDDYFKVKSLLFRFPSLHSAVINVDDDYGLQLADIAKTQHKIIFAYGQSDAVTLFENYIRLSNIRLDNAGIQCQLDVKIDALVQTISFVAPVWGVFNAYNLVAAMLACVAVGCGFAETLAKAENVKGVKGRVDPIRLGDNKTAIIDYSHTPDALISVLTSLRQQTKGEIYSVFGCGGDRDKTKRPLMAEAVGRYSDYGIITDDNPRTENSADIIKDILTGEINLGSFEVIASRRDAIRYGLDQLKPHDVLLIAGKGHEAYQIIGTKKIDFSDYQVVQEWLDETV